MLRDLHTKTLMPGIVSREMAVAQAFGDGVAAHCVLEIFVVAHFWLGGDEDWLD